MPLTQKTDVHALPVRLDLPDDIVRSIAREACPAETWDNMGRVRQLEVARIAAAGAAYANHLRKPDQSLDLEQGANILALARG